jgi:translation initiation factor IF-1
VNYQFIIILPLVFVGAVKVRCPNGYIVVATIGAPFFNIMQKCSCLSGLYRRCKIMGKLRNNGAVIFAVMQIGFGYTF